MAWASPRCTHPWAAHLWPALRYASVREARATIPFPRTFHPSWVWCALPGYWCHMLCDVRSVPLDDGPFLPRVAELPFHPCSPVRQADVLSVIGRLDGVREIACRIFGYPL